MSEAAAVFECALPKFPRFPKKRKERRQARVHSVVIAGLEKGDFVFADQVDQSMLGGCLDQAPGSINLRCSGFPIPANGSRRTASTNSSKRSAVFLSVLIQ